MVEGRGEKWNLEDLAGYIIIGFISRLIGFIMRSVIITLGLISLFATVVSGFIVYVFWIVAPLAIISLFGFGLALIFV